MNLKSKLLAALVLSAAAVPAFAAVTVAVGEPGFYGSIDIGGRPPPQVYNIEPAYAGARIPGAATMYLRVPTDEQRHWELNCGRYNACGRPVYFVHEDWYRQQYAVRSPEQRMDDRRDQRREERREERREDRREMEQRREDRRDDLIEQRR